MLFSELGLSTELVRAVSEKGYTKPTPVQSQTIPWILQGKDILAGAQTGTGKTAGFTLPLLQRLQAKRIVKNKRAIRALILTPTRELASQVDDCVKAYSKYLPLNSTAIFGGVKFGGQINKLRRGVDVLVATPGRLLDHIGQNTIDLSQVEVFVLDEADRMLDMGFIGDIRKIIKVLPAKGANGRQNLLFSATFSDEIRSLAGTLLHNPSHIEVERHNTTVETVSQIVHPVDRERKHELLSWIIGSRNLQQVLVFTRTKRGADRLAKQLIKDGINTDSIHGDKTQGARKKSLENFKKGAIQVLVATDIAARGLDINQLPHVVNFELPNIPEDYIHRIGRTGRAGNRGEALSLVCVDERDFLKSIERLIKKDIPKVTIEGFEPNSKVKTESVFKKQKHRNAKTAGGNNRGTKKSARKTTHIESMTNKLKDKKSTSATGKKKINGKGKTFSKKQRQSERRVAFA